VLGEDNYRELECRSDGEKINPLATEGGKMRQVMQRFEGEKKAFRGGSAEMELQLPDPLHQLNIPGKVEEGTLMITK
jgi:hypothetical protein